ncbi:oocyte zinc finger protein XlCOF7.1-like [Hyperolius riggenbachi]|uniref:oocyte zinc finger protein XlCOF7.1-like n=1 Tax=Hyperolius riggenbachi TaxID=752182 RepID=UPI0035A2A025
MLDTLASSAMTMGHTKEEISEKILNHALEIIYLLTGEKYVIVKKKYPHCCIHPKSGGVPVKCEDVAVFFSMEEWDYIKGHKEDYEDVIMDTDAPSNTVETAENTHLELPDLRAGEVKCASPAPAAASCADAVVSTAATATEKADASTNTSPDHVSDASAGASAAEKRDSDTDDSKKDKSESEEKAKEDSEESDEDTSTEIEPMKMDVVRERPFAGPLYREAMRFEMTEEIQEDGTVRPLSTEATLLDKLHPEIYRYDQNIWSISQRFICGTNNRPYNQPPIIADDDDRDSEQTPIQVPNLAEDKPYRCVACDQLFKYKSSVTRHYAVVHGVKPHQCNECGKRFSTKFNSVVHKCHPRKNKSSWGNDPTGLNS